jgi:hypothetical protein
MFKAAQRFLSRKRYRKAVETHLWYLFASLPDEKFRQVLAAYPKIWLDVDGAFERSEEASEKSGMLAAIIASDLLARLSLERRELILATLRSSDAVQASDGTVIMWVRAIRTLFVHSDMMQAAGTMSSTTREILVSEVVLTLKGMARDERARHRILSSLEEALLGNRSATN